MGGVFSRRGCPRIARFVDHGWHWVSIEPRCPVDRLLLNRQFLIWRVCRGCVRLRFGVVGAISVACHGDLYGALGIGQSRG